MSKELEEILSKLDDNKLYIMNGFWATGKFWKLEYPIWDKARRESDSILIWGKPSDN